MRDLCEQLPSCDALLRALVAFRRSGRLCDRPRIVQDVRRLVRSLLQKRRDETLLSLYRPGRRGRDVSLARVLSEYLVAKYAAAGF